PTSLSSNTVKVIYKDRSGSLWIGTKEGLNRYDRVSKQFIVYRNDPGNSASLSSNDVKTIIEDDAGMLWVGTMGGGLNRFDRRSNTFTIYRTDPANPGSISSD